MTITINNHRILPMQPGSAAGFSLIELMVALVLGALVVLGVVSVFLGNRTTSDVTNKVGQIQQANQVTFQLLARDLQHAGFVGCNNFRHDKVRNLLNNPQNQWWSNWETGIRPIEQGKDVGYIAMPANVTRDPSSDAVVLMFARGTPVSVQNHDVANNNITLVHNDIGLVNGEFVIACDAMATVLFQITELTKVANQAKAITIKHGITTTPAPGNASNLFGSGVNGAPVQQRLSQDSALVYPFESIAWYIGETDDPTSKATPKAKIKNLYRAMRIGTQVQHEEVISGVESMQLTYLAHPNVSYVNGDNNSVSGVNTRNINAVKIVLTQRNTTQDDLAQGLRTLSLVINVRNDRRI